MKWYFLFLFPVKTIVLLNIFSSNYIILFIDNLFIYASFGFYAYMHLTMENLLCDCSSLFIMD